MPTGRGFGTYVGIAKETTAGTEEARLRSFNVESVDMRRAAETAVIPHYSNVGEVAGHAELLRIKPGGSMRVPMAYTGGALGLLLEACLGTVSTTGSGPYAHAASDGDLDTYSLEVVRGDTGESEEFYGNMVDTWSMRFDPRGRALLELIWMGTGGGNRGAPSPTPPALASGPVWVMGNHVGAMTWNSTSYVIAGMTVSGRNGLAELEEFGSLYAAEHKPGALRERYIEADVIWRSSTLQAGHVAGTSASFSIEAAIGSSPKLGFTGPAARIVDFGDAIANHGYIRQRVKWQLLGDLSGPTKALTATLTNANSAYSGS